MDFLKTLFGGSEKETKSTQVPVLTAEQQGLLRSLTSQVSGGLSGPQPSAPAMSVPQTGQESAYFDWVNSLGQQTAIKNLMSGQPGYEVGPEWADKYFEQSVRPEAENEYQRYTVPGIRAAFSGPGYYSNARMGAEAQAGSDLAMKLASAKAGLQYGEEQARRTAIDTAYSRVPGTTQLMGETLKGAGEYSRGIEQEKVAENLQRFLMGEMVDGKYSSAYNPNVALALSILGIQPYGVGTKSTGESTEGIVSGVGSIIKAFG